MSKISGEVLSAPEREKSRKRRRSGAIDGALCLSLCLSLKVERLYRVSH